MIRTILFSFVLLAFISIAGGFVVLAAWDIPVSQKPVEKTLDNARFLEKSS